MKRLLTILFILCLPISWAEPLPPLWNEFCRAQYCYDAAPQKHSKLKTVGKYVLFTALLGPFGLIIPSLLDSNKQAADTYWADRHRQFINEVSTCDDNPQDKALCYMQVRQIESQKTQAREAHLDSVRLRSAVYSRR